MVKRVNLSEFCLFTVFSLSLVMSCDVSYVAYVSYVIQVMCPWPGPVSNLLKSFCVFSLLCHVSKIIFMVSVSEYHNQSFVFCHKLSKCLIVCFLSVSQLAQLKAYKISESLKDLKCVILQVVNVNLIPSIEIIYACQS